MGGVQLLRGYYAVRVKGSVNNVVRVTKADASRHALLLAFNTRASATFEWKFVGTSKSALRSTKRRKAMLVTKKGWRVFDGPSVPSPRDCAACGAPGMGGSWGCDGDPDSERPGFNTDGRCSTCGMC